MKRRKLFMWLSFLASIGMFIYFIYWICSTPIIELTNTPAYIPLLRTLAFVIPIAILGYLLTKPKNNSKPKEYTIKEKR